MSGKCAESAGIRLTRPPARAGGRQTLSDATCRPIPPRSSGLGAYAKGPPSRTAPRRAIVKALREEGHTQNAIAGALGVGRMVVRSDLKSLSKEAVWLDNQTAIGTDGKSYPATRKRRLLPEKLVPDSEKLVPTFGARLHGNTANRPDSVD